MKAELLAVLRRVGLIGMADAVYGARRVREEHEANQAWKAEHPDIRVPPARLIQRTYGTPSFRNFRNWGRQNAEDIDAAIRRYVSAADPKIAEWGCGLGRIAAHLVDSYDYWGFDIDQSSLDWCRANLEGRYVRNRPMPPLPIAEGSFDAIFAVSIFTHLSARQHVAWRDEMLRVLKPGGVFIFTVHGEEQAGGLTGRERAAFDEGELVVRGGVSRGSRTYLAYHPRRYVEETLLAGYEKLEGPVQACGQTLYVGRNNC